MTAALKLIKTQSAVRAAPSRTPHQVRLYQDACEVARILRPERPVFCFSAEALEANARAFLAGFPGSVAYAVKANSNEAVIRTLAAAGMETFDVASVEEMALVRSHAPKTRLHYHNPIKSRTEIAVAYRHYGCRRFAVDHTEEIAKLSATLGPARGIELAVRFRLPPHGCSAHDFSGKFGATPEEAVELLRQASELGFASVLTFHPGSQCIDPEAYARHIFAAAAIARTAGVALRALNVGGGFPARYRSGEVPALEAFFAAIDAANAEAFGSQPPMLECEPGRAIAAPGMSLLTRVKLVKGNRAEVFLNDGIYGALLEVTQAPGLLPHYRVIRNGLAVDDECRPFTVYGPTCDPLDRLPVPLELPVGIADGDFIEFGTLGAYAAATATRFNGYEVADIVSVRRVLAE
jgi:ornithine decarboxylase